MSAIIRFFSDPHFNHENMAKRRGFSSAEEMNEVIIDNWNKTVSKRDVTYILGDITMEKKSGYEILSRLNGQKHIILGNHDRRQDSKALINYCQSIAGMIKYKGVIWLTHCPVHPNELKYRCKYNIHGHVHENSIMTYEWDYLNNCDKEVPHPKYINVCAEMIDYTPRTLEELIPDLKL